MEEEKLPIGIFFKEVKSAYHEQIKTIESATLINQSNGKIDLSTALEEFK